MKKRILFIVSAICASSGALAADISQTVNPLAEATKVMDRCTGIAAKISATPVPKGHGEAVAAAFHNEQVSKSAAAAPGKASAPGQQKAAAPEQKAVAADQQAFFTMIRAERDALQKCGEDYQKVHKTAETISDKAGAELEKKTTPTEDDKKIGAAVMAFEKSEEKLVSAISKLSKDVDYERYVGAVIHKYFLEPVKK